MVGEQAQEMQLAHWISRTDISWLANVIPAWMGMWFAVFPTYETIVAQLLAAILVVGSYYAASHVRPRYEWTVATWQTQPSQLEPFPGRCPLEHSRIDRWYYVRGKTLHLFELRTALQQEKVNANRFKLGNAFRNLAGCTDKSGSQSSITNGVILRETC